MYKGTRSSAVCVSQIIQPCGVESTMDYDQDADTQASLKGLITQCENLIRHLQKRRAQLDDQSSEAMVYAQEDVNSISSVCRNLCDALPSSFLEPKVSLTDDGRSFLSILVFGACRIILRMLSRTEIVDGCLVRYFKRQIILELHLSQKRKKALHLPCLERILRSDDTDSQDTNDSVRFWRLLRYSAAWLDILVALLRYVVLHRLTLTTRLLTFPETRAVTQSSSNFCKTERKVLELC